MGLNDPRTRHVGSLSQRIAMGCRSYIYTMGTDYYLCRLATPWKLKITAPQAATTALLVAGVALWHAPGGMF